MWNRNVKRRWNGWRLLDHCACYLDIRFNFSHSSHMTVAFALEKRFTPDCGHRCCFIHLSFYLSAMCLRLSKFHPSPIEWNTNTPNSGIGSFSQCISKEMSAHFFYAYHTTVRLTTRDERNFRIFIIIVWCVCVFLILIFFVLNFPFVLMTTTFFCWIICHTFHRLKMHFCQSRLYVADHFAIE